MKWLKFSNNSDDYSVKNSFSNRNITIIREVPTWRGEQLFMADTFKEHLLRPWKHVVESYIKS